MQRVDDRDDGDNQTADMIMTLIDKNNAERVREKVYFRVEDTAFFVFEVVVNDGIMLALNTGKRLPLDPGGLYAENDQLYLIHDGERIKFSERAMVRIAPFIEDAENHLVLHLKGETFPIPEARHMCINPSDAKEPA